MKIRVSFLSVFFVFGIFFNSVFAQEKIIYPDSYFVFRDNMYNSHGKTIEQLEKEYDNLIQEINNTKSGTEKSLLIASCDYILGRSYRYFKQNEKAIVYFDKAIELCQQILEKTEIVDAYLILADSISQNCSIKPKSYGFSQGTKIRSNAKKALKIDPKNGTAMNLYNSQNIFTPSPVCNYKEGMQIVDELLNSNKYNMEKPDIFNALSAKAYCYFAQDKKEESIFWYKKALEIYPNNIAVVEFLEEIK
jgi:tetratricopeptide (TPR) repeat protein